ncbi:MAG: type II secretory pathway pseudopilin PulG [Verrucomicrobiales bacterium]|jgi:type II secretory pathway pseudopilin PulG
MQPARNSKRFAGSGFLMKLAWFTAFVFAGLLSALLVYGVRDRLDRRLPIAASNYVADAERALQEYHLDNGTFPEGDNKAITIALMGEETNGNDYFNGKRRHTPYKTMLDPWDNEMRIRFIGDQPKVTSAGADGIFDNEDDVDSSEYLTLKPAPPLEPSAPAIESDDE